MTKQNVIETLDTEECVVCGEWLGSSKRIAALEDENKRLLDALERIVASHPTKPGVHPRSIATAALMAERMLEGGE